MKTLLTILSLIFSLSSFAQWEKIGWNANDHDLKPEKIKFFQYVDESKLFLIDSASTLKIGSITKDPLNRDLMTFEEFDFSLPLDYQEATAHTGGNWWSSTPQTIGYIDDDYSAYFIGEKDSVFVLFHSDNYLNWNMIADIPSPTFGPWQYFYPFNDTTFILGSGNETIRSTNAGITWENAVVIDTNKYTNPNYRFYEDGKGVIVSDYDKISFTTDFGKNWKSYAPEDFGNEYYVFSEGFFKDDNIYVIGDLTVYSPWHNLIMKLDTVNMEISTVNGNGQYLWQQSSTNRHIFFDEATYYAVNSDIVKNGVEDTNRISNIYVNREGKMYPVFKDLDYVESFSPQVYSYTNDMTGHIYFHGNQLIRYNPEACEFINFTEIDARPTSSTFRNILFENSSGEFLNYTGSMVTTYNEYDLREVGYAQTYGSPETFESFTQSTIFETLNADQHYGVVIDYDLGSVSCYFDYTPSEDHILGLGGAKKELLNAYPNPTQNIINFQGLGTLYSISGQYLTEGENVIDLNDLDPGIYILQVGAATTKVFKN